MLTYALRGEGTTPILLLHGFLGSGRNLASLARQWAALNPSLRVILPDLRGHGSSPALGPQDNLGTLAQDVLERVEALKLPRSPWWIGHSLGGRVALAAHLLDPARVPHAVLLDIGPSPLPACQQPLISSVLQAMLAAPDRASCRQDMRTFLLKQALSEELSDWLLMNLLFEQGTYRWRVDRQGLADLHARQAQVDLWAAVESPHRLPWEHLHCIAAEDSAFVSPQDMHRLRRAGCQVHTLAGAGHFLHRQQPEALLGILQGILDAGAACS